MPEPGNLLAWDRYAYTFNNPIFYSDPSGNIPACDKDDWACQYHWDEPNIIDNDDYKFETGLSHEQVAFLQSVEEIVLPIIFESLDWLMMYEACTQGDCSPLMLVGLIPGIPGVLGNKVDDIIGLLPMPKGGVYTLTNPVGKVVRVGYTKDLVRRAGEYGRAPNFFDLIFKSIYGTDDYATRRGLEQMLYDLYNPPLNKNRPIQIRNPNAPSYLAAATKFLNELLGPK